MARTGIPTGDGEAINPDSDSDSSDSGGSSSSSSSSTSGETSDVDYRNIGGDPAGDADRDSTTDGNVNDGGRSSGGGSSTVDRRALGGDPAGDADRDVNGDIDDPDTGSTRTDRLRADAESDPMNPQTEQVDMRAVGGDPAGRPSGDPRRRRRRSDMRSLGGDPAGRPSQRTQREEQAPEGDRVGGPTSGSGIPTQGDSQDVSEQQRQDPEAVNTFLSGAVRPFSGQPQINAERSLDTAIEREVSAQRAAVLYPTSPVAGLIRSGAIEPTTDLTPGEDYTIEQTTTDSGDISFSARLTPEAQRDLSREFAEVQFERETGVDLDPQEDIEIDDEGRATLSDSGRTAVERGEEEQFGDFAINIPVGVEGGERRGRAGDAGVRTGGEVQYARAEDILGGWSEGYSETLRDLTQDIEGADEGDIVLESAIAGALERAGYEEQGEQVEQIQRDTIRGGGEILNVPAVAVGLKEAGEYVGYSLSETARGRAGVDVSLERSEEGELRGRAGDAGVRTGSQVGSSVNLRDEGVVPESIEAGIEAGSAFATYARENPVQFGSYTAGSLLTSGAVMGAASRVSSRAGLASRAAIQPGEEILGYGGHAATRTVASTRTADRLFPNQEPLIFSEEAAIRGARKAGGAARRGVGRGRDIASRVNLEPRMGAGLVPPRVELEARTEVDEPDELGPELDPFDYSDSRLYDPTRTFGETEGVGQTTDPTQPGLPQDIGPGIGPRGEAGGFRGGTVEENFQAYLEETRGRTESAQESFIETEQRRRAETAAAVEPLGMERLGFDDLAMVSEAELESETEQELEQEFELEAELEQEFEFEQEFENELELELEAEAEFELEAEFESEAETEIELEGDIVDPRRRPDDLTNRRRAGWSRRVDRELLNPFTGE